METKKIWEEIHALIEVIWASEKMPGNWELQLYDPYIKREINCHVAIIEESPYYMYVYVIKF
jgi:hypothetical protein